MLNLYKLASNNNATAQIASKPLCTNNFHEVESDKKLVMGVFEVKNNHNTVVLCNVICNVTREIH